MNTLSCVYQPDRDNFELKLKTGGVVHVLSPDQAEMLLYEIQHAVWAREQAVAT